MVGGIEVAANTIQVDAATALIRLPDDQPLLVVDGNGSVDGEAVNAAAAKTPDAGGPLRYIPQEIVACRIGQRRVNYARNRRVDV